MESRDPTMTTPAGAAARALAVPELLEAVLLLVQGACLRPLVRLRRVNRLWDATITPLLLSTLTTNCVNVIYAKCDTGCHMFEVTDWIRRDPAICKRLSTLKMAMIPMPGAVKIGRTCDAQGIIYSGLRHARHLRHVYAHWGRLAECSNAWARGLVRFERLRSIKIEHISVSDSGSKAASSLTDLVRSAPNLRNIQFAPGNMSAKVLASWGRAFTLLQKRQIRLTLSIFGGAASPRDGTIPVEDFCKEFAAMLPELDELHLYTGEDTFRAHEALFIPLIKRVVLYARTSIICSFLMKLSVSRRFLAAVEQPPTFGRCYRGIRDGEDEGMITDELIDAAIAGLRRRKSPELVARAEELRSSVLERKLFDGHHLSLQQS